MALSRSEHMARAKRRDTAPELALRRELWAQGLRYRLDYKTPVGRCDIAFAGRRVAIYVDGCFWHGCPQHYTRPRTRAGFWAEKLRANVARDRRQTNELEARGWTVLRFWEHEVREALHSCAEAVSSAVTEARHPKRPRWHVVEARPLDAAGTREAWTLERLRHAGVTRRVMRTRRPRCTEWE